ncbi:MAG: hypothetical protein ACKOBG_09940 [Actinomycetota bacterium]
MHDTVMQPGRRGRGPGVAAAGTPVGTLVTGLLATVDASGGIRTTGPLGDLTLDWRIFTEGRWIDPVGDATVRHTRPRAAPVPRTAVRVPGGDAVQRVYAVAAASGVVVVEVENASPEAIAVAVRLGGADPADVLHPSRPVGATEPDGAWSFPVPHRTSLRIAISTQPVAVRELDDADTVTRAWGRILERGMRVELPEALQREVDAARADALLAAPSAAAFAALEDWGFDDEAAAMWERLDGRARRTVRRRRAETGVLGAVRARLLADDGKVVDVLPGFDREWLGASLAVHDAPTRDGRVSFALRWHDARPALLWDVPEGRTIRASAIDPAWSASEARGEPLLAAPPT